MASIPIVKIATALLCFSSQVCSVGGLPRGFVDEGVARLKRITDISAIPPRAGHPSSGILLVTLKEGQVYVLDDPDNDPSSMILAADLSERICMNGERGVQSAIVHPDFRRNKFVYIYFTHKGDTDCEESRTRGPVNRCSRFRMRSDYTIDMASERLLFQTSPLEKRYHNGGDMEFGRDNHLYIAIGDGGVRTSKRISQDTSDLLGTLIRITKSGRTPRDNPFADSGVRCNATGRSKLTERPCREIYATGLRNPYKIALDPNEKNKTRLFINDVGGQTWEETNLGGTDYSGVDYGWPTREGPCSGTGNGGNNIVNCKPDTQYQEPEHFYLHSEGSEDGGGAIVGSSFVPNGYWPAVYNNGYFFADFVFGEIYYISPRPGGGCRSCDPPVSQYMNTTFHRFPSTSALLFAPYKDTIALYYGSQKLTRFTLNRIRYVGGENTAPVARAQANREQVATGEEVRFDGSASTDEDGNRLSYKWDFGDGLTGNGRVVRHSFRVEGVFTVVLEVNDRQGGVSQASVTVTVGIAPIVHIERPPLSTMFAVGDVFTLRGNATDSYGSLISSSSLSWEVRQHHASHWHPFLSPTTGNKIVLFPAPAPEDFLAATNSYLEILLTATDRNGLSSTVSRTVMPKTVSLRFDSEPSGVSINLDGYRVKTPDTVLSWEGHSLRAGAPRKHAGNMTFSHWSDDGARSRTLTVPKRVHGHTPEYVAVYT